MSWSNERVELLKKLWGEGLSASQIAAELSEMSRNAVIGKIHRLGLSGRAKTPQAERQPKADTMKNRATTPRAAAKVHRPTAAATEPVDAMAEEALLAVKEEIPPPKATNLVGLKGLMELTESTCRWVTGDVSHDSFYFCGDRTKPGVPYCAHHARIAYQPVSDRKKDRRLAYI